MKAINLATWILTGAVLCVAQTPHSGTENSKPSLQETEKWISQTFTDENTGRVDCGEFDPVTRSDYGAYTDCFYSSYAIQFDECDVDLIIIKTERTDPNKVNNDGRDDSIVSFSLRSIDPATIKMGEPQRQFGNSDKKRFHSNDIVYVNLLFGTTDQAKTIGVRYPHSGRDASKVWPEHECCGLLQPGVALKPDYAPRFMKAFKHAVELCGGKYSLF